ncbi:protein kinase domain-containing protein [Tundrisphaera lichenicola]|uniref:protein kinase domain-containing protein n=1 Tax=Tundrisphaera lichenicola TaxID=2029860 RepID=UPI003EB9870C
MSQSDLFLGWNLGPSDPKPGDLSDRTLSFRAARQAGFGDTTRPVPPAGPPSAGRSDRPEDPAREWAGIGLPLETVGGAAPNPPDAPIAFPRCGEGIGGYRLVSELGRGAFGRVYLAEESGLGNRAVALKVTRPEGDEPRLLARLQHTHIVPIHSVQDDPETGLRLLCMPYFGGANLAQVLEAAGAELPAEATGRSLLEALDIVGKPAQSEAARPASILRRSTGELARSGLVPGPARGSSRPLESLLARIPWWSRSISSPPVPFDERDPVEPARRYLREQSFVRASAWIAARLAEGLEHAHSRGLLHRDLKPSNILIAADGTPMLLDFNLAADSIGPGEGDRAMLGGTLPYMAPEHLDAFNPRGSTPPEAVDERSDLYALGLILFEMVAGRHAFREHPSQRPLLEVVREMTEERRGPAPSARAINREVPPGLDAIIRKCLDPEPDRRYRRAGELAEDLRRFLDDRPLKYTPEPSLGEVLAKWARRNPKVTSGSSVALVSLVLISLLIGGTWTVAHHLRQVSARFRYRVFEPKFHECQFLLNTAGGPVENLDQGLRLAKSTIQQADLEDWFKRGNRSWLGALAPIERDEARRDLAELFLLVAQARVFQAERTKSEQIRRKALESGIARLDLAEKLDPNPPRALFEERSRYHSALGQADEASKDRARAAATELRTGRDFYLLGTNALAHGHPDRAEPALLRAISRDDRPFWAWFALGLCHYDQGRFAESAGDFAVCTVIAPKFAWPWMNRGLALARAGRLVEALEAHNRALVIDGKCVEALVNRGLTLLELGNTQAAIDDLEKAIGLGAGAPPIRAALAEALARSGRADEGLELLDRLITADPDVPLFRVTRGTIRLSIDPNGAEADFRHVLLLEYRHAGAHLGLARLFRADPRSAIPHLDIAVESPSTRLDALELRALLRARLGDLLAIEDVDRLIPSPTRHRLYNAACALALLHEKRPDPTLAQRALKLLQRALESGFPLDELRDDPDLASIRTEPGFPDLIGPNAAPSRKP